MVDASLVSVLACPETYQSVRVADEATVSRVNAAIRSGTLRNREGNVITEVIQTGLTREDNAYLYPVRDNIPLMLISEAIALSDM